LNRFKLLAITDTQRIQDASVGTDFTFTTFGTFVRLPGMLKRLLPILVAPLLLAGCSATFTNLTPSQRPRSTNNLYRVEVALDSRQQSLRWDSIHPQIVVGNDYYPMTPTPLMTNRWEGLLPVPADVNQVHYHYQFDYSYNAIGSARNSSAQSPEYSLKIKEQ
jgi:hypothetical protein